MAPKQYFSKWQILFFGVGEGYVEGVPAEGESECDMLKRELEECHEQLEAALDEVVRLNEDDVHRSWQSLIENDWAHEKRDLLQSLRAQQQYTEVVRKAKIKCDALRAEGQIRSNALHGKMQELWNGSKVPINFWTHWFQLQDMVNAIQVSLRSLASVHDNQYGVIFVNDQNDEGLGDEEYSI